MIEGSPFNVDSTDFIGVFGSNEERKEMGDLQMIFVVESNSTCKNLTGFISKDTIEQFYQYDRAHVKLSVIYIWMVKVNTQIKGKGNCQSDQDVSKRREEWRLQKVSSNLLL